MRPTVVAPRNASLRPFYLVLGLEYAILAGICWFLWRVCAAVHCP